MIFNFVYFRILIFNRFRKPDTVPRLAVRIVLFCSQTLPDDGTPVPKHVGLLYLLLNAFC